MKKNWTDKTDKFDQRSEMFDLTFHALTTQQKCTAFLKVQSHIARLAKQLKDEEASPLDVKLCGDARRVTSPLIISALQEPEPQASPS